MMKEMYGKFERFEGQPIRVFTDDGRVHSGILADAYDNMLRLITRGGCVEDIAVCHIDSIQEPQMALRRNCYRNCKPGRDEFAGDNDGDDECCGRSRCCGDGCRCND